MTLPDLPDIVEPLTDMQAGRCGICGTEHLVLQLDHDHASGLIRGLLCPTCNGHEGRHGRCDEPDACPVCRWRKYPATSWLGWTKAYAFYSPITFDRIVLDVKQHDWCPTSEQIVPLRGVS